MLSAENFVTVSTILPVVHHILKKEVLNVDDESDDHKGHQSTNS